MLEKCFAKYATIDEIVDKIYHGVKPQNIAALEQTFNIYKLGPDSWEMMKYFMSSESLRIDKLQQKEKTYKLDDILNLIKKYDLNKYKRVIIALDNIDYDNIDELLKLNIPIYINLKGNVGLCTLEEFKEMREFFAYFRNTYSQYNLSPLEKVTLAYDFCKFYLYTAEQNNRKNDSRSLTKMLKTGSIVCTGYSVMFCQLLRELGISNTYLLAVDKESSEIGHMRVIVDINDPKYNVSNSFIFDPTWDSEQEMMLVLHGDLTTSYEMKCNLKQDDIVLKKMPSFIRYLFYMVHLYEFRKYFSDEEIISIKKYNEDELVETTEKLEKVFAFDDKKPRDDWIVELLKKVLPIVKKIEGYSSSEIDEYVTDAINIMMQERFGKLDKYRSKTPKP